MRYPKSIVSMLNYYAKDTIINFKSLYNFSDNRQEPTRLTVQVHLYAKQLSMRWCKQNSDKNTRLH